MNETVTTWSVDIQLGERDGNTHAEARLITGVEPPLHASDEDGHHSHSPTGAWSRSRPRDPQTYTGGRS